MRPLLCFFTGLLVGLFSVGCATYTAEHKSTRNEPNPAQSITNVQTRDDTVTHFVNTAREQFRDNRLNASEETINRGLNLAPENPVLWHLLAKIRFLQEQYDESETFASRSLSYTRDNRELSNQNWRLIAHARDRVDDTEGAQRALEKVEEPEPESWFW